MIPYIQVHPTIVRICTKRGGTVSEMRESLSTYMFSPNIIIHNIPNYYHQVLYIQSSTAVPLYNCRTAGTVPVTMKFFLSTDAASLSGELGEQAYSGWYRTENIFYLLYYIVCLKDSIGRKMSTYKHYISLTYVKKIRKIIQYDFFKNKMNVDTGNDTLL